MIRFYFFILFFAFSVPSFAMENEPILSHDGYGQIKFGDKFSDVEKKLGVKATYLDDFFASGCAFVSFPTYPSVAFMLQGKDEQSSKIVRADIVEKQKSTIGIDVGTALSTIETLYTGKICRNDFLYSKETPDIKDCSIIIAPWYDANSHLLMFPSKDGKKTFILEETMGNVITIRAGYKEAVRLVEGCKQ